MKFPYNRDFFNKVKHSVVVYDGEDFLPVAVNIRNILHYRSYYLKRFVPAKATAFYVGSFQLNLLNLWVDSEFDCSMREK